MMYLSNGLNNTLVLFRLPCGFSQISPKLVFCFGSHIAADKQPKLLAPYTKPTLSVASRLELPPVAVQVHASSSVTREKAPFDSNSTSLSRELKVLAHCDWLASSSTVDSEKVRDPHLVSGGCPELCSLSISQLLGESATLVIIASEVIGVLTQQNEAHLLFKNPTLRRGCVLHKRGKPAVVSDADGLDLPNSACQIYPSRIGMF